jgi:hypothetical protein
MFASGSKKQDTHSCSRSWDLSTTTLDWARVGARIAPTARGFNTQCADSNVAQDAEARIGWCGPTMGD